MKLEDMEVFMEGFYVGNSLDYIDKTIKKSSDLSLLAQCNGTEIMINTIKQDKLFHVDPSDNNCIMEFFYLLNGSVEYEYNGSRKILSKGDYFYVFKITESIFFKVLDEVTLLYVSNQPVYRSLKDEMCELTEIVKQVEKKDIYTFNHSERVSEYSKMIAEKLNFEGERLENLVYASTFHDVGKINIPDEILNKPGRLTEEEMKYIKKHPIDGSKMIHDTFLKYTSKIIEQHHERLNGSGYPYGLKGDEIMLEARIIAVADSYDAMTSDRPYRSGMDSALAVKELISMKGTHYDEDVVDVFIKILKEDYNLIL
jgi:HD-GYP domain-containing protein (c-di-GMP phosphodiesterase class II)